MITVAAGGRAAILFAAGVVVDAAAVTITPAAGGDPVLGPTGDGLGVAGTDYSLVWQVPDGTAPGFYTAVLSGTAGGDPITVSVTVFVSSRPVYAPLATIKEALKVTDTARDDLLVRALAAASRSIDRTTGRRFYLDPAPQARVLNPRRRAVRDDDGHHLLVADIGTVDDLTVEIGRAGSWTDVTASVEAEPTDALDQGEPVTGLLRADWPAGQRVRVTARWGWPAVPDVVEQATVIQATRLYRRKDSPDGVTGSAEWGVVRLSRRDPDVYGLIEHLVLPGMA